MINHLLFVNACLLLIVMSIGWYIAYRRQRFDTVDTFWGIGFIVAASAVFVQYPSFRSLVILILVGAWGLRLANHTYQRNKTKKDDQRYVDLRKHWRGNIWVRAYVSLFMLQGALILLISLPAVIAVNDGIEGYGWLTTVGLMIWIVGFAIEAIADAQLAAFVRQKQKHKHETTVLQTGLWRYSRHPNYFGELLQWWAISVIALQVAWGWVGLIGPLVLTYLILYVSGLPPIERRRQHDPEYQKYKAKTSSLILWPPQKQ